MSTEPYNIKHVQELTELIKDFLEKLKEKGYTYPELLVASNSAIFLLAFEKSRKEF